MKAVKTLVIWIGISLAIQLLGFYYVDRIYLNSETNLKTTKIEELDGTEKKEKQGPVKVKVPKTAEDISISSNLKYISYLENEKLVLKTIDEKSNFSYEKEDGAEIIYYKWVPSRDRIITAEKISGYQGNKIVLFSYDLKKDEKSEIYKIDIYDENTKVDNIEMSVLTGLTYVKLVDPSNVSYIYRFDRMRGNLLMDTVPKHISNVATLEKEAVLYYEGEVYNAVYESTVYNIDKTNKGTRNHQIIIDGADRLSLLGTDSESNLYLGKVEDNLITKIYYKSVECNKETNENSNYQYENKEDESDSGISYNSEDFKSVNMNKPAKRENIHVTKEGQVYVHDIQNKTITDEMNGKEVSYEGEFLGFEESGILVKQGDIVTIVDYE